jgi:putative FmdB family regulatory protein
MYFDYGEASMPTYQYECADCHQRFDHFQKFSEDPLTACPTCNGAVRRVIQNVGVVFKGSGWYINDSRPSTTEKAPADKNPPDKPTSEVAASEKPAAADGPKAATAEKPAKPDKGATPAPAATS